MNKTELTKVVSQEVDLSLDMVSKTIDTVLAEITKALKKGDKVVFVGFGNFTVGKRSARKGRNPKTGVSVQIPATNFARFRPGKLLKSALNGKNLKQAL
jgi:DNA-binding protein HU-beta